MADIQVVKLLRALMSSELFRPVHLAPDAAEGVAEGAAVEDPVEEAASVVEISPETVASSPPATPEPKKSRRRAKVAKLGVTWWDSFERANQVIR